MTVIHPAGYGDYTEAANDIVEDTLMRIKIKRHAPRKKDQGGWPAAYRWAAVGTLAAYSAVGDKTFNVALAQKWRSRGGPDGSIFADTGLEPVRRFDIPAGLARFGPRGFRASDGIQSHLSKEGIGSLASPGVSGVYTAEQALQKLLANTGVIYRFTSAPTFLDLKSVTISVDVTTSVDALATASPKYSQASARYAADHHRRSPDVMQEQGVTTLRDALRNVAGISLAAGEGGAQGDNLTIRGFTARNDLFIDGMRDFGSYYRDPFNTQEVEVLQGPSSVTFGRGSTGGVVNQATKTPGLTRSISGDVDFGTDLTRRADTRHRSAAAIARQGSGFPAQCDGRHEGNVAGRDVAENRRFGIAPSLAFGLGTATRWTFSYFHQNADDNPDYGIPWLFNGPAPVTAQQLLRLPERQLSAYLRRHRNGQGGARCEQPHHGARPGPIRELRARRVDHGAADSDAGVTLATPLSAIAITRHEIGVNSVETYLDEQLDLTAHFQTGFIRHDVVAGVEAGRETSDPTRPTWTNVPTTSLLDPESDQTLSGTETITSMVHTTSLTAAAYVLDTMKFGKHWDLTGGFRWDRFDTDYSQTVAPRRLSTG